MALLRRPRFVAARDGSFKVRMADEERALLASLPDQLREVLDGGVTDNTQRLFPPAYPSEPKLDEEYQRLMRSELLGRRLQAVDTLQATASAERLTAAELDAWLRVLNDVRLILGTILDVSEDSDPLDVPPDAPDVSERVAYVVLSDIVGEAVEALAGSLPPPAAD